MACADHLTAPEAESFLSAVEQPLGSRDGTERLWTRMGWDGLAKLRVASQVKVSRDGQPASYWAVVFERLMVPPSGSGRSACLGSRWSLFLWREGNHPDGVIFTGGRFDRAFSSGGMCEDINFVAPAPVVVHYPAEAGGEQPAWVSGSGRGEITPGTDVGSCEFLPRDEAEALHRNTGITCRLTRHRVHFRSTLHPVAGGPGSGAIRLGPGTMRIQLPAVEVIGVRYTIDCALPQAAEMCRHSP